MMGTLSEQRTLSRPDRYLSAGLFAVMTLAAIVLAWQLQHVFQRRAARAWIEQNGGSVDVVTLR
jgi:hypothetical protein